MLFGFQYLGNDKGFQPVSRIVDMFDFKPDAGERVDDLGQRSLGVEMVLEPGECEFHRSFRFVRPFETGLVSRSGRISGTGCLLAPQNACDADVFVDLGPVKSHRHEFNLIASGYRCIQKARVPP